MGAALVGSKDYCLTWSGEMANSDLDPDGTGCASQTVLHPETTRDEGGGIDKHMIFHLKASLRVRLNERSSSFGQNVVGFATTCRLAFLNSRIVESTYQRARVARSLDG